MSTGFQTPWERGSDERLAKMEEGELFTSAEMVPWQAEWQNMPEYNTEDLAPKFQVIINFSCAADVEDFGKLIGQEINGLKRKAGSCNHAKSGKQNRSYWFPEQEIGRMVNKRYIEVKE